MNRVLVLLFAVVVPLCLVARPSHAEIARADINSIQSLAERMLETARTGTSSVWSSSLTGSTGRVRIVSTDHEPGRQPCRQYEWIIRSPSGEEMRATGEGCRASGGVWTLDERASRVEPSPAPRSPVRTPRETPGPTRASPPPANPEASTPDEPEVASATADEPPADPLKDFKFTPPPRSLSALPPATTTD